EPLGERGLGHRGGAHRRRGLALCGGRGVEPRRTQRTRRRGLALRARPACSRLTGEQKGRTTKDTKDTKKTKPTSREARTAPVAPGFVSFVSFVVESDFAEDDTRRK